MTFLTTKYGDLPHAEVVRTAISVLSGKLPKFVSAADVESVAWVAYHRYMGGKGAGFKGEELARRLYVVVRTAIQSELRRVDPLSTHGRRLAKRLFRTRTELEFALGREPTLPEIAEGAGVKETVAKKAISAAATEARVAKGGCPYDFTHDSIAPQCPPGDAADEVGTIEAISVVSREMRKLSPLERRVLRLHVMRDVPLEDVALEVGESRFRVVKIRDEALRKLRSKELIQEVRLTQAIRPSS